jgi:hypothetical protein
MGGMEDGRWERELVEGGRVVRYGTLMTEIDLMRC